ncbi:MAG TPA: hypothetical protein VK586_24100 [Streptosporangiaceae bacterium]|nr:hypothetical protein [Streptosporangiaceae bacterium]
MADSPVPIVSAATFQAGPYGDLVKGYSAQALSDLLSEATRECESETGRRLVPFTSVPETHRAEGMDPDEYTDSANIPMDIQGTLGRSYAQALGVTTLVRHCWLNEFAVRYPELWSYSSISIQVVRSYGGNQNLSTSQWQGAENDSGHVWFQLGQFIPIGSLIRVVYSGGYTVAIPADLVRAGKFMAAYLAVRDLNPAATDHDPDLLHTDALMALANYMRS